MKLASTIGLRFGTHNQSVTRKPALLLDCDGVTDIGAVTLNPERDCIIKACSVSNDIQPLAA
jgi:hypothetical protein